MNIKPNESECVKKSLDLLLRKQAGTEVCFADLLSEALNINARDVYDFKELVELQAAFSIACKENKIKIINVYNEKLPIGLPYDAPFFRPGDNYIRKVVYKPMYACWGPLDRMFRWYVIFERNKITYCREPLKESNKSNCKIKFSYDPFYNSDCYGFEREFLYNFENITEFVARSIGKEICEGCVCDAIESTIDIYFMKGKKAVIRNIDDELDEFIEGLVKNTMPFAFKALDKIKETIY